MSRTPLLLALTLLLISAHANPLRVASADAPLDWNPGRTRASVGSSLLDSVYERLVDLSIDGDPVPALASAWTWLEPNRWSFTLRPGVRFHNGEPFNAPTAKRNLEAQRDDYRSASRTWLVGIAEIMVTSDLSLEIITRSPDAELPLALAWAGRMAPNNYGFAEAGYSEAQLRMPIGTGPYRLLAWTYGRPALLEANPDWWGGELAVVRFEVLPVDNRELQLQALLAGDVTLIADPPTGALAAAASGALQLLTLPDQRLIYLLMDSFRELGGPAPEGSPGITAGAPNPLRDARVRRALSLAIDRQALVATALNGLGTPAALPVLPGSWAATGAPPPPDHNPAMARALLAAAGYPEGFEVTLLALVGAIPEAQGVMEQVIDAFATIGVHATLEAPPFEEAARRYTQLDVSVGIASWGGLSTPRRAWMGMFGSDPATAYFGGQNVGRFIDADINSLLSAIAGEMDDAQRQRLHTAVLARYLELTPTIPLYRSAHVLALAPGYALQASSMDRLPLRHVQPPRRP